MSTDSTIRITIADWLRLRGREKELLAAMNVELERRRAAERDYRDAMAAVTVLSAEVARLTARLEPEGDQP